jgi:hypothetical protein
VVSARPLRTTKSGGRCAGGAERWGGPPHSPLVRDGSNSLFGFMGAMPLAMRSALVASRCSSTTGLAETKVAMATRAVRGLRSPEKCIFAVEFALSW